MFTIPNTPKIPTPYLVQNFVAMDKNLKINKDLVLSLIAAELRNNKLIKGLQDAGMVVEDFYGDLGTRILELIGFTEEERNQDELYDFYNQNLNELIDVNLEEFQEKLKLLALEFYNRLLLEKLRRTEGV